MAITFVQPQYPQPSGPFTPRPRAGVTDFIVHHSVGPKDQDPLQIDAMERARADHFIYMPYNFLIPGSGTIVVGRPLDVVEGASYGRHMEALSVCVLGDFQRDDPGYNGPPEPAQLEALFQLRLWAQVQVPSLCRTYWHGDIGRRFYPDDLAEYATACCGNELIALMPAFIARVSAAMHH